MKYYRLAFQTHQTALWIWKTTALTSLQAVFQLLKIYSALPQDCIRVFTASSKEELNEMLRRENNGLVSTSVTAGQFSYEKNIQIPEQVQSVSKATEQPAWQGKSVASSSPLREYSTAASTPARSGLSSLDKKRQEIECGPGGDHNTPYLFTLPASTPQALAWIRLQRRVQAGELQP